MPTKRVSLRKVREILRCRAELGLGKKAIGQRVGLAASTVRDCVRRADAAGLVWPLADALGAHRADLAVGICRGATMCCGSVAQFRIAATSAAMKQIALDVGEAALLFAALFCALPYIPSHDIDRLPLLPAGAFAIILFAGSRLLRWQRRWLAAVTETMAFALFVWGSNAAANLLYRM